MPRLDEADGDKPTRSMTAAPQDSIAHRTAVGASWMILWRMATRGLGVLSTLVLARILVPADFGLVAIATTYVAAFDAMSATGLQDAVIRSGEHNRRLLDTAFSLSALRGLVNGTLIAVTAPLAAPSRRRHHRQLRAHPALLLGDGHRHRRLPAGSLRLDLCDAWLSTAFGRRCLACDLHLFP